MTAAAVDSSIFEDNGSSKMIAVGQLIGIILTHVLLLFYIIYLIYLRSKDQTSNSSSNIISFIQKWLPVALHLIILLFGALLQPVYRWKKRYNEDDNGIKLSTNYKNELDDEDLNMLLIDFQTIYSSTEDEVKKEVYNFLTKNESKFQTAFNIKDNKVDAFKNCTTVRELFSIIRQKDTDLATTSAIGIYIVIFLIVLMYSGYITRQIKSELLDKIDKLKQENNNLKLLKQK